ncbi:MAG: hypothetical protein VZS44_08070 [Bacilli bacterium]|nr:hypothetical protein [Bacilli bacterium]
MLERSNLTFQELRAIKSSCPNKSKRIIKELYNKYFPEDTIEDDEITHEFIHGFEEAIAIINEMLG